MIKSLLFFASILGSSVLAQSSPSCQQYCDYLCRHYKADLKPVELRLSKRNNGEFIFYTLALRVKNVGQTPVGPNSGSRNLLTAVSGFRTKTTSITGKIPAGGSKWIGLGAVNPRQFPVCKKVKVKVDTNKQFGQWGCQVYSNDTKILRVTSPGSRLPCRRVSLPHRDIRFPVNEMPLQ